MTYSFGMAVENDKRTGQIKAVYFRIRQGKAAKTKEFDRGNVFVDYNKRGELLGVEMLAPSRIEVLDKIAIDEPESKKFLRNSVPREMAPA